MASISGVKTNLLLTLLEPGIDEADLGGKNLQEVAVVPNVSDERPELLDLLGAWA